MTSSERGGGIVRFRRHGNRGRSPCARASANSASSASSSAGTMIGRRRRAARTVGVDHRLDVGAYAPRPSARSIGNSGDGLQLDAAAPALAHLGEHRPADLGLRRRRCRYGCGWRACRAHRRSAGRNPCARATSLGASSWRRGRRRPSSSALGKRPSGLGARGQMWPLSRWVWASTKGGSTIAAVEGQARRSARAVAPAARSPRCGRARRRCRLRAKPSRSTAALAPPSRRRNPRVDERVALRSASEKRCACHVLAAAGAVVPMAQQQMRERGQHEEDRDAGERNQHQRGEHARDVEPEAGFDDAKGEARALRRRAGGEFGDDRADQREAAADPQAAEEIGQRGRQPQPERAAASARRDRAGTDRADCGRPRRGRASCWRGSGKNATSNAQISTAACRDSDRSSSSGAIATIGVTCRITAKGKNARSTMPRLREQHRERRRRRRPPAASASSVMRERDEQRGRERRPVVDQRHQRCRLGAGRMKAGCADSRTATSHRPSKPEQRARRAAATIFGKTFAPFTARASAWVV